MVLYSADDRDLTASIEWVCKVWHRVNHVLDCCSSLCAPRGGCVCTLWMLSALSVLCLLTICLLSGPCQFFDCPMNTVDIQVWFTLLWNHMILPYLSMIFRMSSHEVTHCLIDFVCPLCSNDCIVVCQSYSADCAWVSDPAGWILDGIPWQEHSNSLPILKLERSDFGLHANIPSSCRLIDCKCSFFLLVCLFMVIVMTYFSVLDEGGERFLEHMVR